MPVEVCAEKQLEGKKNGVVPFQKLWKWGWKASSPQPASFFSRQLASLHSSHSSEEPLHSTCLGFAYFFPAGLWEDHSQEVRGRDETH